MMRKTRAVLRQAHANMLARRQARGIEAGRQVLGVGGVTDHSCPVTDEKSPVTGSPGV